ncbi:hypothetical protein GCM10027170_42610 [Aliiglaciecola aliphaticivorans]
MDPLEAVQDNKHFMFIRYAHWDANSLAGASRKYNQQACAPYVKR